jgi:hypothetical protein
MRSAEAMRHLTIVVPFREREAHLERFVPHVKAFFTWHKVHRDIPYRVLIVEEERGPPFNAGALRNIGFVLAREDRVKASFDDGYTCFHDIDYLPVDADYTWTDVPAPIAWYGAERRPIRPREKWGQHVYHNPETFFGAVVLTPNGVFAQVNGYSNMYWGWGWQDVRSQNALHGGRHYAGPSQGQVSAARPRQSRLYPQGHADSDRTRQ